MGHDVEDEAAGHIHSLAADGGEVVNALVDIVIDDSLLRGDVLVLHGEHGAEHCGAHAAGEFERARGLGAITNHAC